MGEWVGGGSEGGNWGGGVRLSYRVFMWGIGSTFKNNYKISLNHFYEKSSSGHIKRWQE